jgi:hypothetical protein
MKDSAQIIWEAVSASFEDNRVIQRIQGRYAQNYHHRNAVWTEGNVVATTVDYGKRLK